MIGDRASFLFQLLKNKKAVFIRQFMGDNTYYLASNRAARRFLQSNKVINLAKKHDLDITAEYVG